MTSWSRGAAMWHRLSRVLCEPDMGASVDTSASVNGASTHGERQ